MTRPVESHRFTERILSAEKDLQQELLNTSLELLPGICIGNFTEFILCILMNFIIRKEDGDAVIVKMKCLGQKTGESGWNRG